MKPFTDTINQLRYGELTDELTKQLAELTERCTTTGKVGSLALAIKLKPGKGGQVEIMDDIKLTLPKPERGTSIMFVTPEGNLQREDPRQKKLPLQQVETKPAGELQQVADEPVAALKRVTG